MPTSPLVALLLSVAAAWAAEPVTIPATPPPEVQADPADLVPWPDAAYPRFQPGSAANATWLLDAPAGHRGRAVAGPDGRLAFADGTPARFWGTTLAYGMTFPEKREEIALMADGIAAAGYNLVRFHHNDLAGRGLGFLKRDPASNGALDPEMMDRLDRLAAELIRRGIYLYVDLVDSRPLLEEDGVPGWEEMKKEGGWKGLFPHPGIVAAWKRAATAFLDHVNPHTGRRWADEPAVVVVECLNENGLFWDWSWKISPRMGAWFDQAWNAWLLERHGGRDGLAKAWTDATGACGLFADEDPAAGSVYRPPSTALLDWDRPFRSKTRGAGRANDHATFLSELATGFYLEATAHLRSLGYGGVVVGSHELQGPTNQAAEVAGTGAISAHLYANPRLAWGARPGSRGVVLDGVDVKSNNWFANLPRIGVAGVPGINGEWTGGSLVHRADVNLGVAAATAFQRVDASLHFTYAHRWVGQPMTDHDTFIDWVAYRKEWGCTFTSVHDAPWMAANRVAAALFTRGDFSPAKVTVDIACSADDVREQNLHALGINGGGGTIGDGALFLPLLHQVRMRFFAAAYDGDAEVVYLTGRTASGDYSKARHAVLVGDNPWVDSRHQRRDLGAPARLARPGVRTATLEGPVSFAVGAPWSPRTLDFPRLEGAVEKASLPPGAMPIGESADGKHVLGWLDDRFLVLPNGRAFGERIGDARWLLRLHLAACARWKLPTGGTTADGTGYRSDNGELAVDWATGVLTVDTPRTQAFSGFVGWRAANQAADLSCTVRAPYAVVAATAIDGQPLRSTRRALLVACGRMQNTGQQIAEGKPVKTGGAPKLVEALRGRCTLRVPTDLAVYALDHEGRRLGVVDSVVEGDRVAFDLSPRWSTIWFELAPTEAVAAAAGWPAAATTPAAEAPRPRLIPLADFVAAIDRPRSAAPAAGTAAGGSAPLADLGSVKPFQVYGNAAAKAVADGIEVTFGKFTKEWSGGAWFPASGAGGTGIIVRMKGDGTRPREFHVSFRAGGRSFRSRNLNDQFENDQWHEVTLAAADFAAEGKEPAPVTFAGIDQVHVGCVGPLMENRSVATFAAISLVAPVPAATVAMPAPTVPTSPALVIPLLADAAITADGTPVEPEWQRAVGFAIDEDHVPGWHFTGTHVGTGSRTRGEKATAWFLATAAGLAVVVDVDKGGDGPAPSTGDWWLGDCVELFSDVAAAGGKPSKQLFLAWSRPGQDRAQGSDPAIALGRARTADGYRLEGVVPWTALGFAGLPTGSFGLDLQVDIAAPAGLLQLNYATGTNEAWVSAKRYLSLTLRAP